VEYILQAAYLADQFDLVYYDLETTGLDPSSDRIYELSAIRINRTGRRQSFDRLVNPERPLAADWASKLGIDPAEPMLRGDNAATVLRDFASFAADSVLVGHNILRFDNLVMEAELARHGLPSLPQGRQRPPHFIDTFRLAEKLLGRWFDDGRRDWPAGGPKTFGLELVAKHLRVELDASTLHHAAADCQLVIDVHQALRPYQTAMERKAIEMARAGTSYLYLGRPRD